MRKVIGCAAKKWYMAAFIILLLALQVFCELALPGLTADIIDIGIGQSGISSVLADSISEEGMERLALLMTKEERERVFAGYVQSGHVYRKNEMTAEEEAQLLSVMTPPMVAVYALSTDGADYKEVLGEDLYVPRDLDTFGILKMLPESTRLELTQAARERIREIPQSLITQAAVNFLREDMKAQGIDVRAVQHQYLLQKGSRMVLAVLGMIAAAVMASLFTSRFAAGCGMELRSSVFGHVLMLEKEQTEQFSLSGLVSGSTDAIWKIQQFLFVAFRSVLPALLLGAGASVLGWRSSRGMRWIVLASFLISFLCTAVFLIPVSGCSAKAQLWAERLKRTVHEQLRGVMVIRAFGSQEREEKRLEEENRNWRKEVLRANRLLAFLMPVLLLVMNGTILILSGQSASAINEGYLLSGELMAYIQYVIITVGGFLSLSMYAAALPEGIRAASQTEELLRIPVRQKHREESATQQEEPAMQQEKPVLQQEEPAMQQEKTVLQQEEPAMQQEKLVLQREEPVIQQQQRAAAARENADCRGEAEGQPVLAFNSVTFQYPLSAAPVLQKASFSVKPGETVAVVGGTGSGKTTLLRLILAEYKANQGNIQIDGKDVENYDSETLSKKISYVPQSPGLFKGSIAENLRFRDEEASERELWEALTASQAEDFVRQMEKGLETEIAQGGKNLSGGQRQRLAAARALVGDAQIYLIDDCFSALDHETASRLRRTLAEKIKGASALMVVSQLRMAGDADRILVLDHGKIVGLGSTGDLMQNCAFYRQLAHSQGIYSQGSEEVEADAR